MVCLLGASAVGAQPWELYPAVYELDKWSLDWSPAHGLSVEAHRVVRINRAAGAEAGRIHIWDTFFQRLVGFQGEVRDTLGRVLFTVGPEAVRPIAPFSEFRLYSGDVIRAVDLVAPHPPYIIEARWTVKIDNPFFWPDWVLGDHWPRRRAVYEVKIPADKAIRFEVAAAGLQQFEDHHPRRQVTRWELHDWVPPDTTFGSVNGTVPLLHVAPREFRFGRRNGRTDSWEALGQWYWGLASGQLELSADQRHEIDQHLKDIVGDRARAAALKDWVSDRWRYVAIEVGIGGWRPHPAREVFVNRYGDCKDVVFLWLAMMRHAGIPAYPALMRARNPLQLNPDFPKDWFDHVVGWTVINGDTLWADPSDRRYPLGTLPRACEARWALAVGPFGGRLLFTPSQTAAQNRFVTRMEGTLDSVGDLNFTAHVLASGHFARCLPLRGGSDARDNIAVLLGVARPSVDGIVDRIEVVASDAIAADLRGRISGWAVSGPHQLLIRPAPAGWVAADTLGGRPDPGHVEFRQSVDDTLIVHLPQDWSAQYWPTAPPAVDSGGEFREERELNDGALVLTRHLRWDALGRTDGERHTLSRIRAAYRAARNAEWLFTPSSGRQPVDSNTVSPVKGAAPSQDRGVGGRRIPSG
ncbi:MAG: DUF3857 domain-containing protein [Candidatus Zixiibacteriota bacterium]